MDEKRSMDIIVDFMGLDSENNVQTDADKEIEQELNELKLMVTAPILRLSRRLKRRIQAGSFVKQSIYI